MAGAGAHDELSCCGFRGEKIPCEALSYAPSFRSALLGGRDGMVVVWHVEEAVAKRELSRWDLLGPSAS